jgi:hypothetical protein
MEHPKEFFKRKSEREANAFFFLFKRCCPNWSAGSTSAYFDVTLGIGRDLFQF